MFPLTPALSLNGEGVQRANRHYEETLKPCVRLSRSDTFTGSGIIERHKSGSEWNNHLSCMFPLTPTLSLNGEGVQRANRHYEKTLKPCMRLSRSDTFTGSGVIEKHESGSEWNNLLSGMFPLTPTLSLNGEGVQRANRHYEETLKPCVRLSRSDTFTVAGIKERPESGSERNNLLSGMFPFTPTLSLNGEEVHCANRHYEETLKPCVRLSRPDTFTGSGIIERHDSVSERNNLLS